MKKIRLFSFVISACLLLGGIASINAKKATSVDAASFENGILLTQVRDVSELKEGTIVYMVSYGDFLSTLRGNPVYCGLDYCNGGNRSRSKYYFNNDVPYIPLQIETGTGSYEDLDGITHNVNTYRFKSVKDKNKEKDLLYPTNGRYLAYGHNTPYPDAAAYVYGDVSFSNNKNEYSNWRVSIDEGGNAHIQYLTEKYSTEIRCQAGTGRSHFGYYQGYDEVQLFRVANLSGTPSFVEISSQYAETVKEGEIVDLTGLEFTVTFDGGNTEVINASFDDEPNFFGVERAVYNQGSQNVSIPITYCGLSYRVLVNIIPNTSEVTYYDRVVGLSYDPRATYILAAGTDQQKYVVLETDVDDVKDFSTFGDVETVTHRSINMHVNEQDEITDLNINSSDFRNVDPSIYTYTIRSRKINNVVYMFLFANDNDTQVLAKNGDLLTLVNINNVNPSNSAVTIGVDTSIYVGGSKLVYNEDREFISVDNSGSCRRVELFKKVTSLSSEASSFTTSFKTFTDGVCVADGSTTQSSLEAGWANQKTAFNNLSADAQGYLANLTYYHNEEVAGSDEDIVDRYEYIVSKYSLEEFMNRREAQTFIAQSFGANNLSLFNGVNNNPQLIIVLVVSLVGVTSLGILIFVKRKKNQY